MLFKSLFLATVVSGASWTYSDQAAWTGQCQTSKSQSPIDIISSSAVSKNSKGAVHKMIILKRVYYRFNLFNLFIIHYLI